MENALPIEGCIHCRPDKICEYHKAENNPATPGPWEINGEGLPVAKVSFFAITAPLTANIGEVDRAAARANAYLIAAAPSMLGTLRAVLHQMEHGEASDTIDRRDEDVGNWKDSANDLRWCREQIRIAIANATNTTVHK